jgi:hypothetical protein
MSFDEKKYIAELEKTCKMLDRRPGNKECITLMKSCNLNKCRRLAEARYNASLKDEDRENCNKEAKGDWLKSFKCTQKIMKKRGFEEADAKFAHCTANKCPELHKYLQNITNKIIENMRKSKKTQNKMIVLKNIVKKKRKLWIKTKV